MGWAGMLSVFRAVLAAVIVAPGVAAARPADDDSAPTAIVLPRFDSEGVAAGEPLAEPDPPATGPVDPLQPITPERPGLSFGDRVGKVKWELVGALGVLTYTNVNMLHGETKRFHFVNEGYFGRDAAQVGLDKLAHAWNGYVFTDVLYKRMARKTGGGAKTAWTAAALGMGLQTYGEIFDGFHKGGGFSWQDMGFNAAGVGFSVARHTVPGLADKLDYRTYFVPVNRPEGLGDPDRFEKQRFLFAVKGSGFAGVRRTPLRFAELHLGYRGRNFSATDRQVGLVPERRLVGGVGLTVAELFRGRTGPVASVARAGLEYFQPPYTSIHADVTR